MNTNLTFSAFIKQNTIESSNAAEALVKPDDDDAEREESVSVQRSPTRDRARATVVLEPDLEFKEDEEDLHSSEACAVRIFEFEFCV